MGAPESLDWPAVSTALERAAAAVGALGAALARHPLQEAWLHRVALTEALHGAAVDGKAVAYDRLMGRVLQLPVTAQRDEGAEAHALRLLRDWLRLVREPTYAQDGDIEAARQLIVRQDSRLPALVAAALGLQAWLREGGTRARGHMAVSLHVAAAGLTMHPLPAVAGTRVRADARRASPTDWTLAFLHAVTVRAGEDRQVLTSLARSWSDWHRRARAGRRRNSRLPQLVEIAAARPVLTAQSVRLALGCSLYGASLLLDELAALGIVVEATGRRNYRMFVAEDLAGIRGVVDRLKTGRPVSVEELSATAKDGHEPPPLDVEPLTVLPPLREIDLSLLVADVERASRRIEAAIARAMAPWPDGADRSTAWRTSPDRLAESGAMRSDGRRGAVVEDEAGEDADGRNPIRPQRT